jgi:hypothetical protein
MMQRSTVSWELAPKHRANRDEEGENPFAELSSLPLEMIYQYLGIVPCGAGLGA